MKYVTHGSRFTAFWHELNQQLWLRGEDEIGLADARHLWELFYSENSSDIFYPAYFAAEHEATIRRADRQTADLDVLRRVLAI